MPQTRGYDRRQFLRNGVARLRVGLRRDALNWTSIFESAVAEAAVGPANQLVMLYLNGGLDGLNCVVPAGVGQLQRLPNGATDPLP